MDASKKLRLIFITLLYTSCAWTKTDIQVNNLSTQKIESVSSSTQLLSLEFTKKYWKPRSELPVLINDNLPKEHRIDIDNDNFYISYNKNCFEVELPTYDPDILKNPLKEIRQLIFKRNQKCLTKTSYIFADSVVIGYDHIFKGDISSYAKEPLKYKNILLSGIASLNTNKTLFFSRLYDISPNNNPLRIMYEVLCEGKENTIYQIHVRANSYQEQLDFVTKHNYNLPEDIMQIISTFKCRKDR